MRKRETSRRSPLVRTGAGLAACAVAIAGGMAMTFLKPSTATAAPTGGPTLAPQVPVTATDDDEKRPASNSPQLAVDPTEPRFVVIANRRDAPFDCALQVSGDGGHSWLSSIPVGHLPNGADSCYAPEIAFASDGTLYYLFVGLHGRGNSPMGAFLMKSTDRARSFSTPVQVLGPERYQVRMALDTTMGDPGRIHLVWLQAGQAPPTGGLPPTPNPIMTAHSDDGGQTFSAPLQISDGSRPRSVGPGLSLGPDHSVNVVYYDLGADVRDYEGLEGGPWTDSTWSLVATHSSDGGEHFSPGTVVDPDIAPPGRVMLIFTMPPASIATDADGRLFVTWHDARNGDWDVFLRRSTDGGGTWGAPIRLNDDRIHDGFHQYLPRVAVSPGGRVDVIFYDRRNGENEGTDVYYTYSPDHGRSFTPNVRLSESTFSSTVGARYLVPSAKGLIEFGSRIALLSLDQRAIAAWTDTSNTRPGIRAQDLMAIEIDFPNPDVPLWRRMVGMALVGGALATAWLVAWPLTRRWRRGERTTARGVA